MQTRMIYRIKTPQQLSSALQDVRRDKKMTQQELARKVGGIAQKTISIIEADCEGVSFGRLLKVLAALDLELEIKQKPSRALTQDKEIKDQW